MNKLNDEKGLEISAILVTKNNPKIKIINVTSNLIKDQRVEDIITSCNNQK